jgi:hypothetical protein
VPLTRRVTEPVLYTRDADVKGYQKVIDSMSLLGYEYAAPV